MARPLRIKTHWFRDGQPRAAADVASALSATIWRTANHRIQNLRQGRFDVGAGVAYVEVLVELLCLLIVAADRIAYRHDPGAWRVDFTTALSQRTGELLRDSFDDLLGPAPGGGYRHRFIEHLNRRAAEYAEFGYGPDGPDFALLRHFGAVVADLMEDPDDRRWALDQAMTVEGPEGVDVVERAMRGLLGVDPKPRRSAVSGE